MYSCGYWCAVTKCTRDTNMTNDCTFTLTILHITPEGRGKYRHVCIYICIYISVPKTLATYSNCMVIFRLHNTSAKKHTLSVWPWHPRVTNVHHVHTVYSRFRASGPVCTLHIAITHVIKVLELGSSHEFQLHLACETMKFQCFNQISSCSVQCVN